ncbi:MAG: tyrosine-protein phosphatase [Acidobacteria bacterium]|nr:tyrosine-protein phosphatase [Acidobacteriota bacterium]
MRSIHILITVSLFGGLVLAGQAVDTTPVGNPTDTYIRTLAPYLENFGVVSDALLRSAQPDLAELHRLKEAGVVSVINLRSGKDGIEEERQACEAAGLKYFSLPWGNTLQGVNRNAIIGFFDVLADPENLPALVHCKRGAERTGTVVAVYRIREHGWDARRAYEEMKDYKFRHYLYRSLKEYVFNYEDYWRQRQEIGVQTR